MTEEKKEKVYKELDLKDYKRCIDTIVDEMVKQADSRESVTSLVKHLSETYGLNKPTIRKVATTIYKNNIEDEEEKTDEFSRLVDLYNK